MTWSTDELTRIDVSSPRPDWDRLLDALLVYWSETLRGVLDDPDEWRVLMEHRMRRRLDDHPTWLWLYVRDDRTLGMANFFAASGVARIAEIYVAPSERRKGLGRFLIDSMRAVLHNEGVARMAVRVPQYATAEIGFWHGCGFEDVAVQLETNTRPRPDE